MQLVVETAEGQQIVQIDTAGEEGGCRCCAGGRREGEGEGQWDRAGAHAAEVKR